MLALLFDLFHGALRLVLSHTAPALQRLWVTEELIKIAIHTAYLQQSPQSQPLQLLRHTAATSETAN